MRGKLVRTLLAGALVASLGGCGLLGGSDEPAAEDPGSLERGAITVGLLPVVDVAPLYQAIERGYFAEQGLEVRPRTVQSGPAAVQGIIGGDLDIAFTSYPGLLVAQSKGAADLRVVADAYTAKPGHLVLAAMPGSGFTEPAQAAGKTLAVTSRGTISDLATMAVLKQHGVNLDAVNWAQMRFPDMPPALSRGDIDGAVLAEPFVTKAKQEIGAVEVLDGASGPGGEFSMAGWGATAKFAGDNPKTVAAFQRALSKAAADMRDRSVLEGLLVEHIKLDPATAAEVTIAEYPTALHAPRIQRVADLMHEFGVIESRLDVAPMLLHPPGEG